MLLSSVVVSLWWVTWPPVIKPSAREERGFPIDSDAELPGGVVWGWGESCAARNQSAAEVSDTTARLPASAAAAARSMHDHEQMLTQSAFSDAASMHTSTRSSHQSNSS